MTPREYLYWIDGFRYRHELQGQMLAHFTACLLNAWTKKTIKGRDLWRPHKPMTKAEREKRDREFRQLVETMGPEAIPVKVNRQKKGR